MDLYTPLDQDDFPPAPSERRFLRFRFLFPLGLLLGLGLGLWIGWVAWPVRYTNTDLFDLRDDYRWEYVVMVGGAYARDGDLEQARQQLDLVAPGAGPAFLVQVTEQAIAQDRPADVITPLVRLARDLGVATPVMAPYLEGPAEGPSGEGEG